MKTPRDFDFLAEAVFEKLRQSVSASTLKRFWGYLPPYSTTRISTLDLLAQFIDYHDWDDFCHHASPSDEGATPDALPPSPAIERPWYRQTLLMKSAAAVVLVTVACLFIFWNRHAYSTGMTKDADADSSSYILRLGQTFKTCSDYLRLFGITTKEHYWDQPLPHHHGIIIWGPEYHHPEWHNDGDRERLMPTITEWREPLDSLLDDKERELLTMELNKSLYFYLMRTNELRITFMKNLTDSGYVFLGIYRTNKEQSDSSHVVWERVADRCDLRDLKYLQQLRH